MAAAAGDVPERHLSLEDVRSIEAGAEQLTSWAATLDNWVVESNEPEAATGCLLKLTGVRTLLMQYLEEGGRGRRRMDADRPVNDFGLLGAAGAEGDLAAAVRSFRRHTMEWAAWAQHADTVIVERLLVERETGVGAFHRPPTHWIFEAYDGNDLPAAAMS